MNSLSTLVLTDSHIDTLVTATAPLRAMRPDLLLYIDVYCGEMDLYIPQIGLNMVGVDETGAHYSLDTQDMTKDEADAVGNVLLNLNSLSTDLILLMEILGGQTGLIEPSYYSRLWVHHSGITALTPEDGDGWEQRNADILDQHGEDVVGRVFMTTSTTSAHDKIAELPNLLAFETTLTKWQHQTSWNPDLSFQSCDKAQWLVFGS